VVFESYGIAIDTRSLRHDPFDTIRLPLLSAASRCASRWRMMTHHDGQRLSRAIVRASTKQAMALTEGIKGGVLRLPPEFRGDLGRGDFGEIITSWQAGSPRSGTIQSFACSAGSNPKPKGLSTMKLLSSLLLLTAAVPSLALPTQSPAPHRETLLEAGKSRILQLRSRLTDVLSRPYQAARA